jgi:hypothetical protein
VEVVLHNAPPEHVKLSRVCVGRRINASDQQRES